MIVSKHAAISVMLVTVNKSGILLWFPVKEIENHGYQDDFWNLYIPGTFN